MKVAIKLEYYIKIQDLHFLYIEVNTEEIYDYLCNDVNYDIDYNYNLNSNDVNIILQIFHNQY